MTKKSGEHREEKPNAAPDASLKAEQTKWERIRAHAARMRAKVTRKMLVISLIFALIVVLIVVAYQVYATVTQDLIIVITPGASSFSLVHSQEANATFDLSTNNYLLCEASCTYELLDLATNATFGEPKTILLQNSNVSITFPLVAPSKGEGQRIYSFTAVCANLPKRTCSRSSMKHRASALITLDYGLTTQELAARSDAQQQLPTFLRLTRDADLGAQRIRQVTLLLAGDPPQALDGLEAQAATRIAAAAGLASDATRLRSLWNGQEYQSIVVPTSAALETNAAINATLAELDAYVVAQRLIVSRTLSALDRFSLVDRAQSIFLTNNDAQRSQRLNATAASLRSFARALAHRPNENALSRQDALSGIIETRDRLIADAAILAAKNRDAAAAAIDAIAQNIANTTNTTANVTNGSAYSTNASTNASSADAGAVQAGPVRAGTASVPANASVIENFSEQVRALSMACARLHNVTARPANSTANTTTNTSAMSTPPASAATQAMLRQCDLDLSDDVRSPTLDVHFSPLEIPGANFTSDVPTDLAQPPSSCCALGGCAACDQRTSIPVLFLHGHSMNLRNSPEYSLEAFADYQYRLQEDGGFIDAGAMTPYDAYAALPSKAWGRSRMPVSVSGTYYYDSYLAGGSYILSPAKSESIDTYAIRLRDMIATLKARTGSEKIIIVTHSMGALVARRYLQLFGTSDVERLIMVMPPSHGVNDSVARFCPFFGADKECAEMRAGSSMLAKINDPSRQPAIPMTVIAGQGCDMGGKQGDGIVTLESAQLAGAQNIIVNGTCNGAGDPFHTNSIDIIRHPEIYDIIRSQILQGMRS